MRELNSTTSRFDRRASSYEDSTLQQFLFVPVQQTALRLALQLLPQARRVLDVGCGTGQLLRHARPCYPTAQLVGVDLAGRMVATASAITPTRLAVRYVHGRAECLPFTDDVFDLVFTTRRAPCGCRRSARRPGSKSPPTASGWLGMPGRCCCGSWPTGWS